MQQKGDEMNGIGRIIASTALLIVGVQAVAQAPATPPPASKPISTSLGMVVFPAKGQPAPTASPGRRRVLRLVEGPDRRRSHGSATRGGPAGGTDAAEGSCRRRFALRGALREVRPQGAVRRSGGRRRRRGCGDQRDGGRCRRWPPNQDQQQAANRPRSNNSRRRGRHRPRARQRIS